MRPTGAAPAASPACSTSVKPSSPPPCGGRERGDERDRRVGRQPLRQHDRAGAGSAAAMRGREGLVQVDVHGVDAEVAGPRLADDGVEIGAVAVEIRPGRVQRLGDLDHLRLEQPARVRIGEHDGRDLGTEQRLDVVHVHPAVVACRHRLDREAEQRGGRRIGAVRRFRHQHDPPRRSLALRVDGGLDRHHAEQLAVGAGLGRQRHRRHAGQGHEIAGELAHQRERALHGRERLQRMQVTKARQPRRALVEPRVVLHGAGAEREQARIDAVIHLAEAHVMAHRLGLGQPRQADGAFALEPAEPRREGVRLVEVDARAIGAADLEDAGAPPAPAHDCP